MDETWYNVGEAADKIWTDGTVHTMQKAPVSRGERLIIVHAGSDMGWVPNGLLVLRTKGSGSFDYHKDMDSYNFEKWLQESLLPNIPHNSAIVMDNAPYHSRRSVKIPRQSNNKTEICQWLDENNIPHPPKEQILKAELLKLVDKSGIKDRFAVEDICEAHGHSVIRLPPYHCHLNPIEMAWAGIKSYIRRNEVATNATEGEEKIKEAVDNITQEQWHKYCEHVKKEAAKLVENELIAEDIQDPIIIDLEADSDSDTEDTDTNVEVRLLEEELEIEQLQLVYPEMI